MNPKNFFRLVKESFSEWSEDNAARLAAALAYYTIFSLAPLLVIVIALAGLFGAGQAAQDQIMTQVGNLAGQQGGEFILSMVQSANRPATGIIATIVGTVTLLFGALGMFGELQNALNTIWEVKPEPVRKLGGRLKQLVLDRLLSFAMVLVIGFLLLVSLVLSAGLAYAGQALGNLLPVSDLVLQILNFVLSFGLITLLFALMFKFLPDAEIAWRDVWLGAAITSLLFTLGKLALGLYLGRSSVGTTFGAAGALAILLIWIYYSAQILFLGAEFTQAYANLYGSRVQPKEGAVKVTEQERAEQGIPHREAAGAVAPGSGRHAPGPTSQTALRQPFYRPALTRVYSTSRRGVLDKVFYSAILASQMIPTLWSLHASKNQRTKTTTASTGAKPPARP